MSMRRLQNRVTRVAEQLPQQRPAIADELDDNLFTEKEREQFISILKTMPEDTRTWGNVPAQQWFTFSLWIHLYKALREQDEPRIAGYRYRLSFTDEQVIAMFLSLATPGETDQTLHRYTPYGLVYSRVRDDLLSTETYEDEPNESMRRLKMSHDYRIDEAWDWLINAGMVQPLYHSHFSHTVEYPYVRRFPHAKHERFCEEMRG